ncbi:MAG: helix-hairpin-helix domain-containing protein [Anaerorhabdus sp.]|uniref:ComEA family DNA-binding protein n=1 Tax=Anaerorhabdus sp. TaxID=1872524 RepID=UPI002FC5A760
MKILLIFLFLFFILCPQLQPVSISKTSCIRVYIKGEVDEETDLCLEPYSTVLEAFKYVTLSNDADTSSINESTILADGDVLIIPKQKQVIKVSINFATVDELCMLKGIGVSTAKKIVRYRIDHGLFQTLEDLMNVPGIKQARFNQIKDQLSL